MLTKSNATLPLQDMNVDNAGDEEALQEVAPLEAEEELDEMDEIT